MSYTYDGWTVEKARVAFYAFQDSSKTDLVDDIACKDGIVKLISELNKVKKNLADAVDKSDETLNQALVFFVCCMLLRSGTTTQRSGIVLSESLEGKSVSYGAIQQPQPEGKIKPQDFCGMASESVLDWAESHRKAYSKIPISVRNLRDSLYERIGLRGRYDAT
jgi:hypothetical protein